MQAPFHSIWRFDPLTAGPAAPLHLCNQSFKPLEHRDGHEVQ